MTGMESIARCDIEVAQEEYGLNVFLRRDWRALIDSSYCRSLSYQRKAVLLAVLSERIARYDIEECKALRRYCCAWLYRNMVDIMKNPEETYEICYLLYLLVKDCEILDANKIGIRNAMAFTRYVCDNCDKEMAISDHFNILLAQAKAIAYLCRMLFNIEMPEETFA